MFKSQEMYEDASLIELVRQYQFLYDKAQKAYKNKTEKENAWKTISEILNTTRKYNWHNCQLVYS